MDFGASLNIFLLFFPIYFFVSKIIRIFADAEPYDDEYGPRKRFDTAER